MTSALPFPLGRKVEHDPASRRYAVTAPVKLPTRSVTHRRRAPILDQGNLGSCTGNAMAGWLGTDPRGKTDITQALAVKLYSDATRLDIWPGEYPPEDTGSSGNAVAKAARNLGLIDGWRHAFTFNSFLASAYDGAVLIGIPWHGDMFTPEPSGYLKCTGEIVGGHEVLVRGVDPRKRHVLCDNSWGYGWGRRGRFWLRWADLERLLADNGDATVPTRTTTLKGDA